MTFLKTVSTNWSMNFGGVMNLSHMGLDQLFVSLALSVYIVAALAFFAYFLAGEQWLKNFAIPLSCIGVVCQFGELVSRYFLTHVWPLTNLYGSLSLFSAMSVAIFVVFAFRYDLWFAGGFILALAATLLAYALSWNEGTLPAVPSLQSYWIKIHVPLVVSSYAAFLVAFVFALLYLLKYYAERTFAERGLAPAAAGAMQAGGPALTQSRVYQNDYGVRIAAVRQDTPGITAAAESGHLGALWLNTLPSLAKLDVLIYRIIAIGLPLLTVGIITGAWWAKEAWGAYWQWDPKETAALFSWIVYAIYMHLHTRGAWRGMRSAWVSVYGFASIMFCYLGVNIWISGLHSYKM
ncbi:MAG: c-type cytochrome biogenesis protein CcsB [Candidatus Eremiobacteraeota bacterium]|nr:c-type cytochrome biogenesis protein CcsB [Candidatus Eremiobacteraeota bacterium]